MIKMTAQLIFLIATVGFLAIYISGRYYLRRDELFTNPSQAVQNAIQEHASPVYGIEGVREDLVGPSMTVDDYEYSAVFQNEGSRVAGKRQISDAMTRYPLDWSGKPPSDQEFQQYQEAFVNQTLKEEEHPLRVNTAQFASISGEDLVPPDYEKIDDEERKILQLYKPEPPKEVNLTSYTIDDVARLVKRVYDRRGENAVIEPSKQGPNVYEIVEVMDKHPKIVWEDDVATEGTGADLSTYQQWRGEEQVLVPPVVESLQAGLDPFMQPRQQVRMNRHDYYSKYSPALDRQTAPTYLRGSAGF